MIDQNDFTIQNLGECTIESPMKGIRFTEDSEHILFHRELNGIQPYLEKGGNPFHCIKSSLPLHGGAVVSKDISANHVIVEKGVMI